MGFHFWDCFHHGPKVTERSARAGPKFFCLGSFRSVRRRGKFLFGEVVMSCFAKTTTLKETNQRLKRTNSKV
jgi:hypothetical protein